MRLINRNTVHPQQSGEPFFTQSIKDSAALSDSSIRWGGLHFGCNILVMYVLILLMLPVTVLGQTEVEGEVSGEWSVEGSPYITTGNTIVPEDANLAVEPGVIIIISPDDSLIVYGDIILQGTEEDSIWIHGIGEGNRLSGILHFEDIEDAISLEYVEFDSLNSVSAYNVEMNIQHCTIGRIFRNLVLWQTPGDVTEISENTIRSSFFLRTHNEVLFHDNRLSSFAGCDFYGFRELNIENNVYEGYHYCYVNSGNYLHATGNTVADSATLRYIIDNVHLLRFNDDELDYLRVDGADSLLFNGVVTNWLEGYYIDFISFINSESNAFQIWRHVTEYVLTSSRFNAGISFWSCRDAMVTDVDQGSGLGFHGTRGDINVENCNLYTITLDNSTGATIEDCLIRDDVEIDNAEGIRLRNCDIAVGVEVEYSEDVVLDSCNIGYEDGGYAEIQRSSEITFRNTIVGAYINVGYTDNLIINNCRIGMRNDGRHDFPRTAISLAECSNSEVFRNVMIAPGTGCSFNNCDDVSVNNNAFICYSGVSTSGTPASLYNNIFHSTSLRGSSVIERYNEISEYYNVWSGFETMHEVSRFSIVADPLMHDVNLISGDYRLRPDSPCIDAGSNRCPRDPDRTHPDIGTFYFDQDHNQAPCVISPAKELATRGSDFLYEARAVDDHRITSLQFLDYPRWLRPEDERDDPVYMGRTIRGRVPGRIEEFGFRVVAIDESNLTDTVDVTIITTASTLLRENEISGVLRADHSPYLALGSLTVPRGEILRIEPGCRLEFQKSHFPGELPYSFTIQGALRCIGTEQDSIIITTRPNPLDDYSGSTFRGITFNNADVDTNLLLYTELTSIFRGINVYDSPIKIHRCYLHDEARLKIHDSHFSIDKCVIVSNPGSTASIAVFNSMGSIANNVISGEYASITSNSSNSHIVNNLLLNAYSISSNSADSSHIERNTLINTHWLIYANGATPTIMNNSVLFSDAGMYCRNNGAVIRNNLIAFSRYYGVHWRGGYDEAMESLKYNCFYENPFGDVVDSDYMLIELDSTNFHEDPLLINIPPYIHHLTAESPCIDAGDPNSPNDPDGSPPDIGAVWFDHDNLPFEFIHIQQREIFASPGEMIHVVVTIDDPEEDKPGFKWSLFRHLDDPLESDESFIWWMDVSDCNVAQFSLAELGIYLLDCIATDGYNLDTLRWTINVTTLGLKEDNEIPLEFELGSVYPNPFNTSTTIEFTISERGQVNISIFDIQGRKLHDLVNGIKEVGKHRICWAPLNFPNGMYLINLSSSFGMVARKVFLIK